MDEKTSKEVEELVEKNVKLYYDTIVKRIFKQIEEEGVQRKLNDFKEEEPKKKKRYSQNWHNYEKAMAREKLMFLRLLKDAVDYMQIPYQQEGAGRPKVDYNDMVKCICIKAFHNLSSWRVPSELKIAKAMGIINNVPKRTTLLKYMKDPKITMMLHNLYKIMAEPLVTIENYFAIDASGISNFYGNTRWMKIRHTSVEASRRKEYTKINIFSGVKTNIIATIEIKKGTSHESPGFVPLLNETAKMFDIHEVYADAGYLSKKNVKACVKLGIRPYIWGKKNITALKRGMKSQWVAMIREWRYNREYFVQRYHLRSNVESTFSALKRKFGDYVRSKSMETIKNEILSKIVCYNASVLSESMIEYNLDGGFLSTSKDFMSKSSEFVTSK